MRSECSGVRDPAAYLNKRALATPSAFDRDFNFISGIERGRQRAERDAENRNISLEDEGEGSGKVFGRRGGKARSQQIMLLRAYDESGVAVVKAPVGMTREKQNRTHVSTK